MPNRNFTANDQHIGLQPSGMFSQNWLPWTATVINRPTFVPRQGPYNAMDLDGSLRYTRPAARGIIPWPYIVGCVAGFMPMQDAYSLSFMVGKNPFGPGVMTPTPNPGQAEFYNLPKRTA